MDTFIAPWVPLINVVLIIAALGGIVTLIGQTYNLMDYLHKKNEAKRELQTQFAEFLKTHPKSQVKSPR